MASKDTVLAEIEREEAGKGLPIPAQSINLNASTRGPAPRPIHAFRRKLQMPCKEGQTGKSRDLAQRSEIGRLKANDLGRGTCGALDNGPCYPHAVSAGECFLEVK